MSANPPEINLITLNCWGLKYLAAHRHVRLCAIGDAIAAASPIPDIVALQECWTQADYLAIHERTKHLLPHAKFYYSGILGSGLVVLSRWPITGSSMYQYPLNGRPTAFFRGDWFVGKGVACTTITVPPDQLGPRDVDSAQTRTDAHEETVIELFNTHLHAPYEKEPNDSYLCHRTAQAWEMAKLLRGAAQRGHVALAAGDFNMVPDSLAHQIVVTHGAVVDAWREAYPAVRHAEAAEQHEAERELANVEDTKPGDGPDGPRHDEDGDNADDIPTVGENVARNGTTCDSAACTWRWPKHLQRRLAHVAPSDALARFDADAPDPRGKRLDYFFLGQAPGAFPRRRWRVARARVGMTARHPTLHCSLSDHFSVEATIRLTTADAADARPAADLLPRETYGHIEAMTAAYVARESRQRRLRVGHLAVAALVTVACHVGVWWTAPVSAGGAFALMLLASIGLAAGLLDGLIGGLFVAWEMSALREFQWEVAAAKARAHG